VARWDNYSHCVEERQADGLDRTPGGDPAQTSFSKGFADRTAPERNAKAIVRPGTFAKLPKAMRESSVAMNSADRGEQQRRMRHRLAPVQ
jgi:hypothetical protein